MPSPAPAVQGAAPSTHHKALLQQYKTLLAQYEQQNGECRNRLFDAKEQRHANSAHPLLVFVAGAIIGAIAAALFANFWTTTKR